ncbi:hypothetical protein [Bacterioplanoides sp.]|uniref:hypothetical protein n=1 Tax=Bacterioplanoides sp. TaxID=2066072 RepID=UPI003B5D05A1
MKAEETKMTTDELVAQYISTHIAESDKENRMISKLGAWTALIGSLATLIGAFSAWSSAGKAEETARNVEVLLSGFQKSEAIRNQRQSFIDENQKLLNLYNEKELSIMCSPITLTDSSLWNTYEYCLLENYSKGQVYLGSSDIPSKLRASCGLEVGVCKKKKLQN